MHCSFSGQPVPTEKLFILYYPPAAAHETLDKSSFAAARAREALAAIRETLETFFPRFVVTRSVVPGIVTLVVGVAAAAAWGAWVVGGWGEAGFAARYLPPFAAIVLILFARSPPGGAALPSRGLAGRGQVGRWSANSPRFRRSWTACPRIPTPRRQP